MAPRRIAFSLALALAFLAAGATAQGCIPCSDCIIDSCWQVCSSSCNAPSPSQIIVSGDQCKASGANYGPTAAANACAAAKSACESSGFGATANGALGAVGPVTLSQCSNVAQGSCIQSAAAPCWLSMLWGHGNCDARTFRQIFHNDVNTGCTSFAETVTGVTPGTNSWAPTPAPWGGNGFGATAPAAATQSSNGGSRRLLGATRVLLRE